jgi:hypothetical protein
MADAVSIEEKLQRETLEAYRQEYDELSQDWRNLDTKAQGNITVCGIFLAAIVAFAKDLAAKGTVDERSLLIFTAVLLAVSVGTSLITLIVRPVLGAPLGAAHDRLVADLIRTKATSDAQILNYIRDQISFWKETNRDLQAANSAKAKVLLTGQILLVFAILAATILIVLAVTSRCQHHFV